jgi:hypothetical protein
MTATEIPSGIPMPFASHLSHRLAAQERDGAENGDVSDTAYYESPISKYREIGIVGANDGGSNSHDRDADQAWYCDRRFPPRILVPKPLDRL